VSPVLPEARPDIAAPVGWNRETGSAERSSLDPIANRTLILQVSLNNTIPIKPGQGRFGQSRCQRRAGALQRARQWHMTGNLQSSVTPCVAPCRIAAKRRRLPHRQKKANLQAFRPSSANTSSASTAASSPAWYAAMRSSASLSYSASRDGSGLSRLAMRPSTSAARSKEESSMA